MSVCDCAKVEGKEEDVLGEELAQNISNSFPFATNICFSRFQAGAAANRT